MAKVLIGNVKGPQGDAATISVGTVSTGAAGSNAAVTNSGTSGDAILNFTIPQGAKGDDGTPGVTDYATASAAGLVRIGTDFNIDSSTGTISENNTFSQASTLAEINSGDSHATILGKIKKFMNTLMPSTFVKDNLTSTDTDKALSAKQGKLLAAEDALLEGDLATVQTSSTASRAFSAGEYLVLEGQLYKVTSNIANGGTIAVGTNVSATTAGAQLKALNDSLTRLGTKNTYFLTLNSTYAVAQGTSNIFVYGLLALVHIGFAAGGSAIPVNTVIATLPTNLYGGNTYVANENIAVTGWTSAGTSKTLTFTVRSNGDIVNGIAMNSSDRVHFDIPVFIVVS